LYQNRLFSPPNRLTLWITLLSQNKMDSLIGSRIQYNQPIQDRMMKERCVAGPCTKETRRGQPGLTTVSGLMGGKSGTGCGGSEASSFRSSWGHWKTPSKKEYTHTWHLGLQENFSHARRLAYLFPSSICKHEYCEYNKGWKVAKTTHPH
jgi:hypothetical protein